MPCRTFQHACAERPGKEMVLPVVYHPRMAGQRLSTLTQVGCQPGPRKDYL